ncbi:metallophosphoesterase family protein [Lichenihabitans psoromatis]|uniref:metallophosphoesterase family protein n=1 Tax=Lichenihabitans psoromatis TaxID=2528642 RepID=UPI00103855AE|nr:metallophosphoesterase family protein [Lichenihabitans psoromatis]
MRRLAVVADIHGNLLALDAVLADLDNQSCDRVINLGDCVSGPLWPRETLDRLRELDWATVRGNHDRWVGTLPRAELTDSDLFASDALDDEARRWLATLPTCLDWPGGLVAFHASPDDDNAYLTEEVVNGRLLPAPHQRISDRLGDLPDVGLVLAAHSHIATVVRLPNGPWIVNPGSVGCPAYVDPDHPAHVSESGSPLARYAIVTVADDRATGLAGVEFRAIPYDHEGAARRAESLGEQDWTYALRHGFIRATEAAI